MFDTKFEKITKILFSAVKIPISAYNADGVLMFEFFYRHFTVPHSIRKDIILPLLLKNKFSTNFPEIHTGNFYENYISMAITIEGEFCGTVIAGPFMRRRMSEKDVETLICSRGINKESKDDMLAFYNRLRLLTETETADIAMHFYYYYYNALIMQYDVIFVDANKENALRSPRQSRAEFLEAEIFSAVKKGSDPVAECKKYIMSKPYSEITLKNLSEVVNLNPSYLSRMFKTVTGSSVTEYSQMEKIEEAKILIEEGTLSLSEIGDALGFYDYNHFAKIFKSITGTTPNSYKRINTRSAVKGVKRRTFYTNT